jgi:group I intron endonuclease
MNKIIGIYKITSPSGKVYIGESKDIFKRWYYYKKMHCVSQVHLYNSFLKYGIESHKFEIIMECSLEDLKYFESCFQEIYRAVEKGLNLVYTKHYEKKQIRSEYTKKKARESMKNLYKNGYVNPMQGKTHSEETKEKMRKPKSEETKRRMSESKKKLFENPAAIEKNRAAQKKAYSNPEVRENNRQAQLKRYRNGFIPVTNKMVIDLSTGFFYESALITFNSQKQIKSYSTFKSMLNGARKNKTSFQYV